MSPGIPGKNACHRVFLWQRGLIANTTPGGIRCIRTVGCAVTGPLARNRPSDPSVSTSSQQAKPLSEGEAIRLAQAGDAPAFEFLYELHGRRVYALCLRMVGNPSDAEDLMQEAFLQLFRKIGTFRGESAFFDLAAPDDRQRRLDATTQEVASGGLVRRDHGAR